MSIKQYDYTFTCPKCKRRSNRTSMDDRCLTCGENVLLNATLANQGWNALMIVILAVLVIITLIVRFI